MGNMPTHLPQCYILTKVPLSGNYRSMTARDESSGNLRRRIENPVEDFLPEDVIHTCNC